MAVTLATMSFGVAQRWTFNHSGYYLQTKISSSFHQLNFNHLQVTIQSNCVHREILNA
jgi:hypothetical protein